MVAADRTSGGKAAQRRPWVSDCWIRASTAVEGFGRGRFWRELKKRTGACKRKLIAPPSSAEHAPLYSLV